MSLWKNAKFWTKLKDSTAVLGTVATAILKMSHAPEWSEFASMGITTLGVLIAMWFEDKDGNNIPDIFETAVTTKITSDSPIKIETTEETTKQ